MLDHLIDPDIQAIKVIRYRAFVENGGMDWLKDHLDCKDHITNELVIRNRIAFGFHVCFSKRSEQAQMLQFVLTFKDFIRVP